MHEQEQGLRLHHQHHGLIVGIVVEMLMDAAVLDDQGLSRLPRDVLAVMDVMALALEDVEDGAVHMAVLLSAHGARRVDR